jgi:putative ABC transport system permease protein
MQKLRLALRSLAQNPGFTAVAVLTLALGIGLSASSFSMANTFLLRDVPYPDAGRLVRIFRTTPTSQIRSHSPGNLLDLRASATSFTGIAIYNGDSIVLGEPGQPAEQVSGMLVSPGFFELLGVSPMLGRGFLAGEEQPDKGQVAVITQRAWVRRYGSDPGVLGRSVRLNGQAYAVVGVLPAAFDAPLVWGTVEFIIPRTIFPTFATERSNAYMQSVARLKPGVSLAQAQSELATIAARLAREYPKENQGDGLRLVELHDSNMDNVSRSLLWLMTGLSLTMLLIACANLASLQVARAFGRVREYAVRAALGATGRQLMQPLIIESLVLSVLGGLFGLLVASWSNDILGRHLLINNEPGFAVTLDWRVFTFAAVTSLVSGLAFGLAPAWLAARAPCAEALKEGSRSATGGPSHQRLKRTLIVGELALALALVGVAASFGVGAKTFSKREVGWQVDGLFAGYISMPFNRYPDDARNVEFHRLLLERLSALPGVEHPVLAGSLPVYSMGRARPLVIEGQPVPERGREPAAETCAATSDFFSVLRIPLRQGRFFPPGLKADDPLAAIVNESLARQCWPGQDPIGKRVRFADRDKWMEVIGVVADIGIPARLVAPESRLQLYRPLSQAPTRNLAIVLRAGVPPETLAAGARTAVAAMDPDLPVTRAGAIRDELERNLANLNLVIVNLSISGGMGLLIAGVGLYGVISQLTAQRTRDIGVRIALGAGQGDIMRMVLGEGAWLLLIGLAIGVPVFYALNFLLLRAMPEMHLPGIWLLGTTMLVLGGTTLFACYVPARRAAAINHVEALRAE